MKNIKALIIAAILLTFSITSPAQDSVLATGNPPLTQRAVTQLIDLYEFALGGRFTTEQKKEFSRRLVIQWKSNDTEDIDSYRQLLEIYGKLSVLDDAKLREAQVQFRNELVAELKKNPDGNYNPLLIAVYNQSHADSPIETGASTADFNGTFDSAGANTAGKLIGKWQTGSASSTNYTNSTTGASSNAGGTQVLYTFFPDGRFEYASLYSQTGYSCTTSTMLYKTGHIEISGSTLTLVTEGGKFTSQDSCNRQYNYEKPAKLDRETYQWSVLHDENGTKLCLRNPTVNGCAYKRD